MPTREYSETFMRVESLELAVRNRHSTGCGRPLCKHSKEMVMDCKHPNFRFWALQSIIRWNNDKFISNLPLVIRMASVLACNKSQVNNPHRSIPRESKNTGHSTLAPLC